MDTERRTGRTAESGMSRKEFLSAGAGASIGAALSGLVARNVAAAPGERNRAGRDSGGYGELSPRQAENDPGTYLALPEGFKYTVFGVTGTMMSDGNPTPPSHDGMAAFPESSVSGGIRLIRNHEVRAEASPDAAIGENAYDPLAGGGTTTLVVDPETRLLKQDFVSLSGTHTNCAGGPTPRNTWLTCEETTVGRDEGFEEDHGYIFEIAASAEGPVKPVALKEMGRFVHEATATDPATGIVYETEDDGASGFYRFLPNDAEDLSAGGRLQMLAIKGRENYDTRTGQRVGKPLPVEWVDIDDPDPNDSEAQSLENESRGFASGVDSPEHTGRGASEQARARARERARQRGKDAGSGGSETNSSLFVYEQGQRKGAATFARLEGCWYGDGSVFLNSTSGGDEGLGQVWQYRPRGSSGGQLILLFESESPDQLDAPDNLCVSPRGGLAICEDGDAEQYVCGLTQQGKIFDFALNLENNAEFAGATFSPDGETLFVNVQTPGRTFAIWGPWEEGAL